MIVFFFFYYFDEATGETAPATVDAEELDIEELEFIYDDTIRKVWHNQKQEWYFSIIDVVAVLTDSEIPKRYWSDLKIKLEAEGNETYENIVRLKMKATDGKMRLTDCADTEQLLRIIQSIPSKKAEPFKMWLAKVGKERLEETANPELAINRAIETYRQKGYSEKWITQRLRSIEVRKDLTAEWKRAGIEPGSDYAALTNILTHAWSGKTTCEYKAFKSLKKQSLRDNMTNTELVLNQLAEISATELSKVKNPIGFNESKNVAIDGGHIAANARKELEEKLGHSVISSSNSNSTKLLDK